MAGALLLTYSFLICRILTGVSPFAAFALQDPGTMPTIVHVNIITETRATKPVELNGKPLTNYSPTIIREYASTGIVLDNDGYIMTFLGYSWVDIQSHNPKIKVTSINGLKWDGRLIGIDQHNGVAVIKLEKGKLPETPVCVQCEIKNGVVVRAPIFGDPGTSRYEEAKITSVANRKGTPESRGLMITVNHPFRDTGQPIFTMDHRVLGYVVSQDPVDRQTVIYPINQLLASANEIIKTGGDIRVGWLGVFLPTDSPSVTSPGVVIQDVIPDGPAQKAGLAANDSLLKFNGREIQSSRQFVRLVQNTPIGSEAVLDISRAGKRMTVRALIEARRPQPNPVRLSFNFPVSEAVPELSKPQMSLGFSAYPLTPYLADALRMPGQTGLFIAKVEKQKPADLAGVLVGDVIVAMDGQPILDTMSFTNFLMSHQWRDQLVLQILRKGTEHTITIPIPKQNQ